MFDIQSWLPSSHELLIYAVCAAAWALVLLPSVIYLSTLWKTRRENLTLVLKESSLRLYFYQFHPASISDGRDFSDIFKEFFHDKYGRQHYALPYLVLFVLTTCTAYAARDVLLEWDKAGAVPHALPAAALVGAFLWVILDQIDQIRKRDVTPCDLWGYSLRIVASVPFGWALSQFMKEDLAVPLAFVLGAFPTRQLAGVAKRFAAQNLHLADEPDEQRGQLERLQCIGKPEAERFAAENVKSIADLAYQDPIDLTIRTNFNFNYVMDCISQALLWMYFEDDIAEKKLYELSVRGAQEVATLISDHEQWHKKAEAVKKHATGYPDEFAKRKHTDAEQTIGEIAKRLDISEQALMVTLRQVAEDPYTKFLCAIWKEMHVAPSQETIPEAVAA